MFAQHQLRSSTNSFHSSLGSSNNSLSNSNNNLSNSNNNLSNGNTSPPPFAVRVSPWIVSALNKQHPDLVPLYRDFFRDYLCGGFFQLCVDVDKFKEEADENQMKVVAMQIFDKYWSPVTQYDIIVKDKVRDEMAQKIDSWNITTEVFDPAIRKLEQECFKKFCMCERYASFMADRGTYVRTASPRRRLSITDMFIKKGAQGRRSSLGVGPPSWSPSNSAEIMDLDDGFITEENGLTIISEECC